MHTGTIPITLDNWLGMERAVDLEFLTYALQYVARHLELIAGINADAGSYLVLLLTGHHLAVGTGDINAGVETGTVMCIGDGTSEGVLGTCRAVVGSLRTVGYAILWPAEGCALIEVEEGEFLFETKPDFFIVLSFKGLGGCYYYIVVNRLVRLSGIR